MKNPLFALALMVLIISCRTEEGNERIAQASKNVGTSAATAIKNVKSGIEKVSKIEIEVSETLKTKGLSTGKVVLGSKDGGRHNLLNIYMIFDKKINKNVSLKVFNSQNEEIGRSSVLIKGNAGEAKYLDFIFDKRTNIDRDHKIVLE